LRQRAPRLLSTPEEDLSEWGVVEVRSRPAKDGLGVVLLYPEGIAGSTEVTWDEALGDLEKILFSCKLSTKYEKLRAAPGREKHVFLGTTFSTPWALHFALSFDADSLPPEAPRGIPPDITHLWLMHAQLPQRCLMWSAAHGWLDTMKHWATP
jgi:hypothetical protein